MVILEKLQVFLLLNHEKAESRTPDAFVFLGQTYIFNVAVIFVVVEWTAIGNAVSLVGTDKT